MLKRLSVAIAFLPFVLVGFEADAAAELALKRVMLSTGGVAYYEHEADVEGDAVLSLEIRLDQVDDVLKSVVVYDDIGGVGSIRLPGREPLRQVFRDLPFSESDLASPVELLGALQGVEVEVAGTRTVRGRVLSVVPETVARDREGETVTHHRVSLMTPEGVQQFILEDAGTIRFVDGKLASQIDNALTATARHRVMDRRIVEIEVKGKGRRHVRVAYVVAAPLWKTAYRLTVQEGGKTGRLQGWAILENQSGHAWNGVDLTLVSGNPVTFHQALYESYYVDRPEIPVEVLGRILPGVDTGSMALAEDRAMGAGAAMEAPMMLKESRARQFMAESAPMAAPPAPAMARAANRIDTREAATHVLFRMPNPVSVDAGHSLVVPIIDADVPASRLALYQNQIHETHPLAAVRLVNEGSSGLPPGIFTVYERSAADGTVAFVGDARMDALPKGEERFASFALDQRIRVDREQGEDRQFQRASVSQGVLRLFTLAHQVTTYRIQGPAKTALPVVIEHPRLGGWSLVEPDPNTITTTTDAYRIAVPLDDQGRGLAKVVLERVDTTRYALVDQSGDRLMALSRHGSMPDRMRAAFAEAAQYKTKVEALKRALEDLEGERTAIGEDQARIRDNLGAAPAGSDLQERYLRKLASQEDRIEVIAKRIEETRQRIAAAEQELAAYIGGLNF